MGRGRVFGVMVLLGTMCITSSLLARGAFGGGNAGGAGSGGEEAVAAGQPTPWFTGPLLTPSAHVIPYGHQNYEPYVYWVRSDGSYDRHWKAHSYPLFTDVFFQMSMQFGVAPYTEFDITPQFAYNNTKGIHSWRVSDLPVTLAFQLLKDSPGEWYPAIKLRFSANVPLGRYDRLDPKKLQVDVGGSGSWSPDVGLVFSRLFHVSGHQFFSWRMFLGYTIPNHVSVRGLSIYGGAPSTGSSSGTKGSVKLGSSFVCLQGFEYSLTQNWVFALDVSYQHSARQTFSGKTPPGTHVDGPSSEHVILAPALEYNWNSDIGLIVGPSFSVAGRNADRFISYVAALNIYR